MTNNKATIPTRPIFFDNWDILLPASRDFDRICRYIQQNGIASYINRDKGYINAVMIPPGNLPTIRVGLRNEAKIVSLEDQAKQESTSRSSSNQPPKRTREQVKADDVPSTTPLASVKKKKRNK